MRDQLHEQLAHLRLRGIDAALDAELDRAEREGSPTSEVLWRLLAEEQAHRREQSLAYRLTQAKLPWRWTLDSFPFERQPGVDRGQIRALAGLDFLRRNENILLIGPPDAAT
jgi:DNA replication protein DnaC